MQWISAVLSNEEEKNLRLNFKAEKRDNMESVLQNLLGTVRNNEKKGQDRFIALEDTLNLRISTLENKHNLRISKLELDVAFLKDSSYDTTNAYISSSISKLLLDDRLVNYANTFFTYTPTTDSPDIIVGEIFLLARAKHVELDLITLLFEYNPKWVAHFTSAKIFSQHFKNLKQKCNGGSHYLASEHELRRMTSEFESNLLQDGLRIWADFALEYKYSPSSLDKKKKQVPHSSSSTLSTVPSARSTMENIEQLAKTALVKVEEQNFLFRNCIDDMKTELAQMQASAIIADVWNYLLFFGMCHWKSDPGLVRSVPQELAKVKRGEVKINDCKNLLQLISVISTIFERSSRPSSSSDVEYYKTILLELHAAKDDQNESSAFHPLVHSVDMHLDLEKDIKRLESVLNKIDLIESGPLKKFRDFIQPTLKGMSACLVDVKSNVKLNSLPKNEDLVSTIATLLGGGTPPSSPINE